VVARPADMTLPFYDFLDYLNKSEVMNANFYLEYFPLLNGMENHISEPLWVKNILNLEHSNVWFGNGNTVGKLHFDPFDNLLGMITGKKKFIVFDPHRNEDLYEGHIREAQFEYDLPTKTFKRSKLLDSTSMVMSPVNIDAPDLLEYPLFLNKIGKSVTCEVGPGEMLYLPAFWWHEVKSSPDHAHRNIAINYWYKPFYDKEYPCAECRLAINPISKHLLDKFYE